MARMYPEWLDAGEVDSPYEPQLFECFKHHLSDEYVVIYSVRLQKPRPPHKGGVEDVEVDFVIAHPRYGLLCLEAKGGRLAVDSKTGRWRNIDSGKPLDQSPFNRRTTPATACWRGFIRARKRRGFAIRPGGRWRCPASMSR